MELARVVAKNQRQEVAVSFPQRQIQYLLDGHPGERSFRIFAKGRAAEVVDAEDEAEPILPLFAKTGPANGAS